LPGGTIVRLGAEVRALATEAAKVNAAARLIMGLRSDVALGGLFIGVSPYE
jgi:hypothetical protein